MPQPSSSPTSEEPALRVAVMTMTRDEADMLPRWVHYYGAHLGMRNLFVIDDNSTDGSTADLPCTVLHLPAGPWKASWMQTRVGFANSMSRGLLACFDVVIFTDVDEFLVPDPARYAGLFDYLTARADTDVVAPVAVNLLHAPASEPAIDPSRPILEQRRFVKWAPDMCKPLVKRQPATWLQGFHGIKAPFVIDPELYMIHLKYYDVDALADVADRRQHLYLNEGRGSGKSSWPLGAEAIRKQLAGWIDDAASDLPEFEAAECDLAGTVHAMDSGFFRSLGPQLGAVTDYPLRVLPERFRSAL